MGKFRVQRKRRSLARLMSLYYPCRFRLPALGLAVAGLFFTSTLFAQTGHPWRDGLTRQDIISTLGEPEGDVANGNSERMIFRGNLLVTLENNQVTEIQGALPPGLLPLPAPAPVATPAPAPVAATAIPVATVAAPAEASANAVAPTPAPTVTTPSPASTPSSAPASGSAQEEQDSEKIINDFSSTGVVPAGTPMASAIAQAFGPGGASGGGNAGSGALAKSLNSLTGDSSGQSANTSAWSTVGTWEWFVAGLLLKTIIMTGVLKGVFAYKEFPVLWREAALVAAGVSLCNQVLAWLFSMNDFGKIAAMVQADQLVAGAVLLWLITKFTAAKEFPTAAPIMIAAMSVNIAVGYAQLFFL